MRSKFCYSNLAETNERLKREARQYLDSLDVTGLDAQSINFEEDNPESANEGAVKLNDCTGLHYSSTTYTKSSNPEEESGDELPEMAFRRTSTCDDDNSLLAMAHRLDDASVISYSSFDVRSHCTHDDDNDKLTLISSCATGNSGTRVKKVFPKEKGSVSKSKKQKRFRMKSSASTKGKEIGDSMKQVHYVTSDIAKMFEATHEVLPNIKIKSEKSRSVSQKSNIERCNGGCAFWQSSNSYKSKPMSTRRKSAEGFARTELKTTDGRNVYTVEEKTASKCSISEPRKQNDIRFISSPPTLISNKYKEAPVLNVWNFMHDDMDNDEVQSIYDSDCNTEIFYEVSEDEWYSEEDEELPMVGTSVLEAVEVLNNTSISFKIKNMLGIRG